MPTSVIGLCRGAAKRPGRIQCSAACSGMLGRRSRRVASVHPPLEAAKPPRRNRGSGYGGSVRLVGVVHVPGKKGGCSSEARPNSTSARGGLLNFLRPLVRPVAFGEPRSPLLDATSPEFFFFSPAAEEGASDLCFAHKLPAYARARTLLSSGGVCVVHGLRTNAVRRVVCQIGAFNFALDGLPPVVYTLLRARVDFALALLLPARPFLSVPA